ncbi:PEP-utilizing enzyme [Tessaracoccus coleopterorum]|uniref:PEP-utilizing enzyme n=1 Tax=Tessaracoccus coleopterorum TaxID=2714950 RepID=UPI0018D36045
MAALEALDLAALPWRDLVGVPERALETLIPCRDLRIDYLPGAGLAIARLVAVTTVLRRRALIADLLGGARTRTEDANDALAALGDQARADPTLLGLIEHGHPGDELAARFPRFAAALGAFITEFGRRETVSPLLVSPPTLAESRTRCSRWSVRPPWTSPGRGAPVTFGGGVGLAAGAPTAACLRGLRRRFEGFVAAAQAGVAFREDTHFYFTAALPVLRRSLLEIGRRLTAVGLLNDPAEVFHLRWAEVAALPGPAAIPAARLGVLRDAVVRRAALRSELEGVPLFDASRYFPAPPGAMPSWWAPRGAGTVTGVARIVLGADDFGRLGAGEVLVCPYTNPSWTPLFQRAAAVVVDSGSTASHAAIVAREYGLPAVMGTGRGTSVIADGQRVRVDGTHGTVVSAEGMDGHGA